jgi:Tfp pilus assembly protein FimT
MVVTVAILALLVGVAYPIFQSMAGRSTVDAASRQLLGDVRRARSLAITQGWEYKVFGFNVDAASPFANQYRLLARANNTIDWTAYETAAPFQDATRMAGPWVNVTNEYTGARMNPGDPTPRFWIAFNARGIRIELDNFPLVITDGGTVQRSVNVSLPGVVTIQ